MLTKEQLKHSIDKYGDSSKLVNRLGITEEEVTEIVVLAPWWHPNKLYNKYDCKVELLSDEFPDVHRITYNNKSFLHIRSYVGATNVGETVLLLSFTKCKRIIFVGSVGSISNDVNIGDLIIPLTSVSGEAFSSYMYEAINKESLHKEYHSTSELYNATTNYLRNENIDYKDIKVYSVDTIAGQFAHIDEILNLGCKAIEMETSALFSACLVTEKECVALLAVSDNTILNKSLISGRTDEDMEKYHKTRYDIIPMIIFSLLENNNEI